jgi:hypothetical protein
MNVRFQVLTAASMMFRAVFWVVLQCKIILHGSTTQKTALNMSTLVSWTVTSCGLVGRHQHFSHTRRWKRWYVVLKKL